MKGKTCPRKYFPSSTPHLGQKVSHARRCTLWPMSTCSLVSTYVVCERLSVMHEPAGVVENLVQILQNTPILKYSFRIPPSPLKMKIVRDLGTLTFQFQNTPLPRKLKFRQILALCEFSVSEYPLPPQKIEI